MNEDRYYELMFFYILIDLLNIRKELNDVYDTIEFMNLWNEYEPELVKQVAQIMLTDPWVKPTREEFLVLTHKKKVPIKHIKKRTGLCNKKIYSVLNAEKDDPRAFYKRLSNNQIAIIKPFVDRFNKFKGVGLPWN